jgi:predicted Zn-dependent peptidase
MGKFQTTTLDSGLIVATDYLPNNKAASACWHLRSGANRDIAGKEGTAHFFEHLLAQGNEQNPRFDFMKHIEHWGQSSNFVTGPTDTYAYTNTIPRRIPEYLELLGQSICHAAITHEQVEEQREIIRQECMRSESDNDYNFIFHTLGSVYGGQQPGRKVLGTLKEIETISRDDLLAYRKSNYLSEDMVLVISGSIPHEHNVKLIGQAFKNVQSGKNLSLPPTDFVTGPAAILEKDSPAQTIAFVISVPSPQNPNYKGFNWLTSVLRTPFNDFMRKSGTTYNAEFSYGSFGSNAFVMIKIETEPSKIDLAHQKVKEFFTDASSYITEERYQGILEGNEMNEAFNWGNPKKRINSIVGSYGNTGNIKSFEDVTAEYSSCDIGEIRQALIELKQLPIRTIGMGPVRELASFSFDNNSRIGMDFTKA